MSLDGSSTCFLDKLRAWMEVLLAFWINYKLLLNLILEFNLNNADLCKNVSRHSIKNSNFILNQFMM